MGPEWFMKIYRYFPDIHADEVLILNFEQNVWEKGAVYQPVFTVSIYLLK